MTTPPPDGWFLFDGACGICSRWARSWEPRLNRIGLSIAPLQSPWVQGRTGIPPEELVRDVRLLRADGTLLTGPDVYRFIMHRIWWLYPGYLVSLLPGFRSVFDWAYRTVARHRGQISAACGLPPTHHPEAETSGSRRVHSQGD